MSLKVVANVTGVPEFCDFIKKLFPHKCVTIRSIASHASRKENFVIVGRVCQVHNMFQLRETYKVLYLKDAISECCSMFRVILLHDCAEVIENANIKEGDVLAFLNPRLSQHTALRHTNFNSISEKQILYGGKSQIEPTIWLYRQVSCRKRGLQQVPSTGRVQCEANNVTGRVQCEANNVTGQVQCEANNVTGRVQCEANDMESDDFVTKSMKSARHLFLEDDDSDDDTFEPPSPKNCCYDNNHMNCAQNANNQTAVEEFVNEIRPVPSSQQSNQVNSRKQKDNALLVPSSWESNQVVMRRPGDEVLSDSSSSINSQVAINEPIGEVLPIRKSSKNDCRKHIPETVETLKRQEIQLKDRRDADKQSDVSSMQKVSLQKNEFINCSKLNDSLLKGKLTNDTRSNHASLFGKEPDSHSVIFLDEEDSPSSKRDSNNDWLDDTFLHNEEQDSYPVNPLTERSAGKRSRRELFAMQKVGPQTTENLSVIISEPGTSSQDKNCQLSVVPTVKKPKLEKDKLWSSDASTESMSPHHHCQFISGELKVAPKKPEKLPEIVCQHNDETKVAEARNCFPGVESPMQTNFGERECSQSNDDCPLSPVILNYSGESEADLSEGLLLQHVSPTLTYVDQHKCSQAVGDVFQSFTVPKHSSESEDAPSRIVAQQDDSVTQADFNFFEQRKSQFVDHVVISVSIQLNSNDSEVFQPKNVASRGNNQKPYDLNLLEYSQPVDCTPCSSFQNNRGEVTNEIVTGAIAGSKNSQLEDEIFVIESQSEDNLLKTSKFSDNASQSLSERKNERCNSLFAESVEEIIKKENRPSKSELCDGQSKDPFSLAIVSQDSSGKKSKGSRPHFAESDGEVTTEMEDCVPKNDEEEEKTEPVNCNSIQSLVELSNSKTKLDAEASDVKVDTISTSQRQKQNAVSSRNSKKYDYTKLSEIKEDSIINTFAIVQNEPKEVFSKTGKSCSVCVTISVTDESIYPKEIKVFLYTHHKAVPKLEEKDIIRLENLNIVTVDGKLQGNLFSGWNVVKFDTSQITRKNLENIHMIHESHCASVLDKNLKRFQELSTWMKSKMIMEEESMAKIFDVASAPHDNSCCSSSPQTTHQSMSKESVLLREANQNEKSTSKSCDFVLFENEIISELIVSNLSSLRCNQLLNLNCKVHNTFLLDDGKTVILVSYGCTPVSTGSNFTSKLNKFRTFENWLEFLASAKLTDNFLAFFVERHALPSDFCRLTVGKRLIVLNYDTVSTECINHAVYKTIKCTIQVDLNTLHSKFNPEVIVEHLVVDNVKKIKDQPHTSQWKHQKSNTFGPFAMKLDPEISPLARSKKRCQELNDFDSQVHIKSSSKKNIEPYKQSIDQENLFGVSETLNIESQDIWCSAPMSQKCNFGLYSQMSQFTNDSQLANYVRAQDPLKNYLILRVKPYLEDSSMIVVGYCDICKRYLPFYKFSQALRRISCADCQSKVPERLQHLQPVFMMVLDLMQLDTTECLSALLKSPVADNFLDCTVESFVKDSDKRKQVLKTLSDLASLEISLIRNSNNSSSKVRFMFERVEVSGKSTLLISAFEKSC